MTRSPLDLVSPLVLLLALSSTAALADNPLPDSLPAGGVLDLADLIPSSDETYLTGLCANLHRDAHVPLGVVIISSMSLHGGGSGGIERFASSLIDRWGSGHPEWNRGLLLVISKGDRKARIELGRDYGHTLDSLTSEIMQSRIVPSMRVGDLSAGVRGGTRALSDLGRGERSWAELCSRKEDERPVGAQQPLRTSGDGSLPLPVLVAVAVIVLFVLFLVALVVSSIVSAIYRSLMTPPSRSWTERGRRSSARSWKDDDYNSYSSDSSSSDPSSWSSSSDSSSWSSSSDSSSWSSSSDSSSWSSSSDSSSWSSSSDSSSSDSSWSSSSDSSSSDYSSGGGATGEW